MIVMVLDVIMRHIIGNMKMSIVMGTSSNNKLKKLTRGLKGIVKLKKNRKLYANALKLLKSNKRLKVNVVKLKLNANNV